MELFRFYFGNLITKNCTRKRKTMCIRWKRNNKESAKKTQQQENRLKFSKRN